MKLDWIKEIPNWEKEYLTMNPKDTLTTRQKQILEGAPLESHEGMVFGKMYADWKKRKGWE